MLVVDPADAGRLGKPVEVCRRERPRRLRDAATVWGAMAAQHGTAARDGLWSHPDLLPTPEDLDEPLDFVARQGMDDELAALTEPDPEDPDER